MPELDLLIIMATATAAFAVCGSWAGEVWLLPRLEAALQTSDLRAHLRSIRRVSRVQVHLGAAALACLGGVLAISVYQHSLSLPVWFLLLLVVAASMGTHPLALYWALRLRAVMTPSPVVTALLWLLLLAVLYGAWQSAQP